MRINCELNVRSTGLHPHRIEILDRADNHAVVHPVAHYFHLEFFPADEGFIDQDFVDRRKIETACCDRVQLVAVIRNTATHSAERERRANYERECSDLISDSVCIDQ